MGGLAELFSGMISMGLGAYLAAVTERDTHSSREEREDGRNAARLPSERRSETYSMLERYGVSRSRRAAAPLVEELCADRDKWVRFKMDFALGLGGAAEEEEEEKPGVHRACISGL